MNNLFHHHQHNVQDRAGISISEYERLKEFERLHKQRVEQYDKMFQDLADTTKMVADRECLVKQNSHGGLNIMLGPEAKQEHIMMKEMNDKINIMKGKITGWKISTFLWIVAASAVSAALIYQNIAQ